MQKGFIEAHIARGNRQTLTIGLVLVAIGVGASLLLARWIPLVVAIPGVFALVSWIRRVVNPTGHPVYKNLAKHGDVRQVVEEVNRGFAGARVGDRTHFGKKWLAQGDTYGLQVVLWTDIVWLYLYTVKRNGYVTSRYVEVRTRDGSAVMAPTLMKEEDATQMLRNLYERAPWAEVGYTDTLIREWDTDRASFLQRVDARREAMSAELQPA